MSITMRPEPLPPWQQTAVTLLASLIYEVMIGNFPTPADLIQSLSEISDRITQDHGGILTQDDPINFMSKENNE